MDSGIVFRELLAGNPETGNPGMLETLNMSVEKFAAAIGVTRTSVYFYLTGKTLPSSMTVHKMARVLGIPVQELLAIIPTREQGAPLGRRGPYGTGIEVRDMKYVKRKTDLVGSAAATEVKRVLDNQHPPLGNREAAELIGVNYETIRSICADARIPSTGVLYGLARGLKLDDEWIDLVLKLRERDLTRKKLSKAIDGGPGKDEVESLITVLDALTERQLAEIKRTAVKLALCNLDVIGRQ